MHENQIATLFLTVTQRCNLTCSYCSADSSPKKSSFMSLDDAKSAVRSWISGMEGHSGTIVFTGGEPTLWGYECLHEVCAYVRSLEEVHQKRITVGIQTNGTRVSDDFIEWCLHWNVAPSISMDGPSFISDLNRGRGDKTMSGLRRLQKENIDFGLIICLTREIYSHLSEVLDWLEYNRFYKVRINEIGSPPDGRVDQKLSSTEYFLARKEIFLRTLNAKENGFQEFNSLKTIEYARHYFATKNVKKCHCDELHCGAGREMASVNPNGSWTLCVERSMTGGTIEGPFSALDAATADFWKEQGSTWEGCLGCEARAICDQGCVVYHKMDHDNFLPQCLANKRFWKLLQNLNQISKI